MTIGNVTLGEVLREAQQAGVSPVGIGLLMLSGWLARRLCERRELAESVLRWEDEGGALADEP